MAKLKSEEILTAVEEMSVLELSELVKALEEKFGVSAQAVAAAPAAAAAGAGAEGAAEEQTVFNVVIASAGAQKIAVIKAVRELVPTLGLAEAKALVDSAPKEVLTAVNKKTAEEAKEKLTAAGATVELK
jgi:large subunit ribosomal protein L7/L12